MGKSDFPALFYQAQNEVELGGFKCGRGSILGWIKDFLGDNLKRDYEVRLTPYSTPDRDSSLQLAREEVEIWSLRHGRGSVTHSIKEFLFGGVKELLK